MDEDAEASNSLEKSEKPDTEDPQRPISSEQPKKKPDPKESVKPKESERPKESNKPKETPKPTTTPKPTSTQKPSVTPAHTHTWVNITEQKKILVKEAWDEPIYDTDGYECTKCGHVSKSIDKAWDHADECGYGFREHFKTVQVDTIHHDAEYRIETVVVGQKCTGCGAKK